MQTKILLKSQLYLQWVSTICQKIPESFNNRCNIILYNNPREVIIIHQKLNLLKFLS